MRPNNFFFAIATLKLEPHQQQQLRAPAQPPKKWPEPGLETLSFSKRAPAFDPSSSRFWPLKTRIFGCTFLTHHLSELYNLCSRGVKSLPRKIFHTFFVKKNRKSFPAGVWLTKRAGKKDFFLQSIVVRKIEGEMEGPNSSTEPLKRYQNVRKMGTMIVGRVVNFKMLFPAIYRRG